LRHRDRPHADGVAVLDDINEGPIRPALHRRRRHHDDLAQSVHQQPDIDELAGPQLQLGIRELGLHLHGPGGLIDLVVDDLQHTAIDHGLVVAAERLDRQRPLRGRLVDAPQLLLRQAKEHRNRLDLRDDDDAAAAAIASAHDVALVDHADSGAP
jgi:hypothetical protein